jgi:hypothetical protein
LKGSALLCLNAASDGMNREDKEMGLISMIAPFLLISCK